jgi:uncharacterized membrane protein HdeD (DUF308 family)
MSGPASGDPVGSTTGTAGRGTGAPATSAAPASATRSTAPSGTSRALKAGTSPTALIVEGVVAIVVGVILLLAPSTGANTMLLILGLLIGASSVLTAWQLYRGQIGERRRVLAAFRSGSGMTTAALIVVAYLAVGSSQPVTAATAVILGVGLVVFGAVAAIGAVALREPSERLPIGPIIVGAGAIVVGAMLAYRGTQGYDEVTGAFQLLGVLVIVVGAALAVYGFTQRRANQPVAEA